MVQAYHHVMNYFDFQITAEPRSRQNPFWNYFPHSLLSGSQVFVLQPEVTDFMQKLNIFSHRFFHLSTIFFYKKIHFGLFFEILGKKF